MSQEVIARMNRLDDYMSKGYKVEIARHNGGRNNMCGYYCDIYLEPESDNEEEGCMECGRPEDRTWHEVGHGLTIAEAMQEMFDILSGRLKQSDTRSDNYLVPVSTD